MALSEGPYNDTNTPLAGNATFTGTWRDRGIGSGGAPYFGATFYADQNGTAYIDASPDQVTVVTVSSLALTAGQTIDLNVSVRARNYRVRFVNGGAGQGTFNVLSSFTSA